VLFNSVCIASLGVELPPNVVSSAELEERLTPLYDRLKLPKGRLELMTGIKERRFWDKGTLPSDIAISAGKKAIEKSGIPKEKIKALFHASVCRDFLEPATANVVHNGLGLFDDAMIFDISNACLGVLNGMVTIANMIELGQIEAGIVVSGEMGEKLVNGTVDELNRDTTLTRQSVKPAFASLTIGSAGVAVVLAKKELVTEKHKLLGGVARCATKHNQLCKSSNDSGMGDGASVLMDTDSELLLHAGCDLAEETFPLFKDELKWENQNITRAFTHQVGTAHKKLLYEKIGLDIGMDFSTVEFLGNTGSAALPVTFAMGIEDGTVNKGDKLALLGIGSGLNSIMLGVEW